MSKARQAAEAYFAQPPSAADAEASVPVVVHSRLTPIQASSQARGVVEPEALPTAVERARRVFRVAGQGDRAGVDPNVSVEKARTVDGSGALSAPASTRKLRRLMRMPGEVVIVRSAPADSLVDQDTGPLVAGSRIADRLLMKAPLALLVALLRAVDIEIQRTRARDAAAALQRIRQAMAEHGITVAELRSYGVR